MTTTCNWGIVATGGISYKFGSDLLVDPSSRKVSDIKHKLVAVGSRSVESAQNFIDKLKSTGNSCQWGVDNGVIDGCKAYGSYQGVYDDPNVQAVYVGSPHPMHYENCRDALIAGKNVLCEKPFTTDLAELDDLIALAKKKNLFLMEAVWTRFHPIAGAIKKVIDSGKLGAPRRFQADFSMDFKPDTRPDSHRMIAPELGGGSLLDQGPYPSVWAMLLVHHHPMNKDKNPKVVSSHQTIYPHSGVDVNSRWLVEWENTCQGYLMTDMGNAGHRPATAVLQCDEGDLVVEYPPYAPSTFHIVPRPDRDIGKIKEKETFNAPIADGNNGLSYEADEVARCIRDGKIESNIMPLSESRITQGWLDKVRRDGNTTTKGLKGKVGN